MTVDAATNFISLVVDYDVVRDHGLRILSDETSCMLHDPHNIELSCVVSLLAGISLALGSVVVTPETVIVRDAIRDSLDKLGDKSRKLEQAKWESEDDDY